MSEDNRKWLIKDEDGYIRGPYSTDQMLRRIRRGDLSGEEFVSLYPQGQWYPISQDPQFYDQLLEFLRSEAKDHDESDQQQTQSHHPPGFKPQPSRAQRVGGKAPRAEPEQEKTNAGGSRVKRTGSPKEGDDNTGEVIELVDLGQAVKKAKLKKAIIPVILIVLVAGLAGAFLFLAASKNEDRIHLIGFKQGQKTLGSDEVKKRSAAAVRFFISDTFSNYVRAENELVSLIEGDPRNAQAMGLLCLTYLELWPYARQDAHDLKVLSDAARVASSIDPVGADGGVCRVVDLFATGRIIEAKGVIESVLNEISDSETPPSSFYYLKARLLQHTGDHQSAIAYTLSAQKLWPQWLRTYVLEAELHQAGENYTEAAQKLRQVLQVFPAHAVAKLQLGLLEYKHFNHSQLAKGYLQSVLGAMERVPSHLAAQGYFGLAEMALQENRTQQALDYAQKAYSRNPSHVPSRNLIVKLGGVEELNKTRLKDQQLVFEGDQFVREGDCKSAQAHYKSAYELNPKNGVAAMKAARCLWELSFTSEAFDWLDLAIRAEPDLIEAYTTLADYHSQRFNFEVAARILAKARNQAPKNYEVYQGYALVELRRLNPKGAINFAQQALNLHSTAVDTHVIMAKAHRRLKQYDQAYRHAAKAIEVDFNHREAQTIYAKTLVGLQGAAVAIQYLQSLIENYPLITEYRMALAEVYAEDQQYGPAESTFRQIAKVAEKPKAAYVKLANLLHKQQRYKEALELLLEAAVLDPSDAEPLFSAGTILMDAQQPAKARLQFERVLKTNSRYPLVHYHLGRAALAMSDAKEALTQSELERQKNPNMAEAYLLAAEAYTQLEQFSLCAREYQKAVQLRSQGADIYIKMARCYRLSGNFDVAISMLNQAAQKESGNAEIYKEQGAVFEMKGDYEHAIESYDQYFLLNPYAPDRARIQQRIDRMQGS